MTEEDSIGFECVQREKSHAEQIMQWRNDPVTMQMSFNYVKPKTLDVFYPEFLISFFALNDLPSLFALFKGERVASIRFDPAEHPRQNFRKCAEVSINLSPDKRGMGLGEKILTKAGKWAAQQGYDALLAKIKKNNRASLHVFEKAGFQAEGSCIVETAGGPEEVALYLCELSPIAKKRAFIIAEAGSNWAGGTYNEGLDRAYALIEAAKEAGADAVKFQVFRAEAVYVKNAGVSDYLAEGGIKEDIFELFKEIEMPYEMIPLLAKRCEESGLQFLASTFSPKDFSIINPYVNIHKIASYEISYPELIKLAARSGKPLLLSTGASDIRDIDWAVETFRNNGGAGLALLQCTAKYPAPASGLNLRIIPWLKRRYGVAAGLSDHSLDPFAAPVSAIALGAEVIEKHFTLSKRLKGPDHAYAIEPAELKAMVRAIREAEAALGSSLKKIRAEEEELYAFCRRGIQALHDIQKGEILKLEENMAVLRPGKQVRGVHPRYLDQIEGRPAAHFIAAGSGIQFKDVENEVK